MKDSGFRLQAFGLAGSRFQVFGFHAVRVRALQRDWVSGFGFRVSGSGCQRFGLRVEASGVRFPSFVSSSSPFLLSSLEFSDANVYEPSIRALLGARGYHGLHGLYLLTAHVRCKHPSTCSASTGYESGYGYCLPRDAPNCPHYPFPVSLIWIRII